MDYIEVLELWQGKQASLSESTSEGPCTPAFTGQEGKGLGFVSWHGDDSVDRSGCSGAESARKEVHLASLYYLNNQLSFKLAVMLCNSICLDI